MPNPPSGYTGPFNDMYTNSYNGAQGIMAPPNTPLVHGYIRPDGRLTYGYDGAEGTLPGNVPGPMTSPNPTPNPNPTPTPNTPPPSGSDNMWQNYWSQMMQWIQNGAQGPMPMPQWNTGTNNTPTTGSGQDTTNVPNSDRPANMLNQEVGSWVGAGGLGGTGQGTSSGDPNAGGDNSGASGSANPQSGLGHPDTPSEMSQAHTQSVQNAIDNPNMAGLVSAIGMGLGLTVGQPISGVQTVGNQINSQIGLPTQKQLALALVNQEQRAQNLQMMQDFMTARAQQNIAAAGSGISAGPGPNESQVNAVNDQMNTSDPMAQAAAQVADNASFSESAAAVSGISPGDPQAAGTAAAGAGAGDGGSGDSVVCTELYAKGHMTKEVYDADVAFAKKYIPAITVRGYHWWGVPLVERMRRHRLVMAAAKILVRPWTDLVTKRLSVASVLGLVLIPVGVLICTVIGAFVKQKDVSKLYGAA